MEVKVEALGDAYRVVLPNGDSFAITAPLLPAALSQGGNARLVVVPVGENATDTHCRSMLNELLRVER